MSFKQLLDKAAGRGLSGGEEVFSGFDVILAARLVFSCLLFAASLLFRSMPKPWPLILLLCSAAVSGFDILAGAVSACMSGRCMDKCVVITVSVAIAFAIGESVDAAAIVIMFQMGRVLIGYVGGRTEDSFRQASALPDFGPVTAVRGEERYRAEPCELAVGDSIVLNVGEILPCDCIVLSGMGSLDTAAVSGNSEPLFVSEGDEICSGGRLLSGSLVCEVVNIASESTAAVFAGAVQRACSSREHRVLRGNWKILGYLPLIIAALGIITAVSISLFSSFTLAEGVRRAVSFLVLANMASLAAAVPFIHQAVIRRASASGVLFADKQALENLMHSDAVAFDCAGTLTDGQPRVSSVKSGKLSTETLLKVTAHAMAYSSNRFAKSVINAYGGTIYIELLSDFHEYPGGVEVFVDNVRICAGNLDYMTEKGVAVPPEDIYDGMVVYVAVAETYAGRIVLTDGLKADAAAGVSEIAASGIGAVVMLTEEPASSAAKISESLGIREYYAGCGPEQKAASVGEIKRSLKEGSTLIYVSAQENGGGSGADVEAVMGGADLAASLRRADVAILNGRVTSLADAVKSAKNAEKLIFAIAAGALAVKLIVMVMAVFGFCAGWFSAFMDSAASIAAVLASSRAFD